MTFARGHVGCDVMNRRSSVLAVSLFLTALLAACGGGSGDDGGADGPGGRDAAGDRDGAGPIVDGGTLPPSDDFDPATLSSALAEAICNYRDACEPVFAGYAGATHASCVAETTARVRAQYDALVPLIPARRVAFDQDGFDACVASFTGAIADCDLGVDARACDAIFLGVTPVGAPCSADPECGSAGTCVPDTTGGCTTCRRRAQLGESCEDTTCVSGASCLAAGAAGTLCVATTVALGATCGTIETGLCRGQLQCVGETTFTCARPAAPGEVCDETGVMATCGIYQGQACDAGGHCVALTFGDTGTPCGEAGPATLCKETHYCDSGLGSCQPLPGDGVACRDGACTPGAYCDGAGTCRTEKASGATCGADLECGEPLYCIGGTCGALAYETCE